MSSVDHDHSMLGAYALGGLDPREAQLVHEHLTGCPDARREVADLTDLRAAMDDIPPEAFLDGPPEDGDLLLQRTLRQVRSERQERIALAAPEPGRWQEPPAAGTSRSRRALLLVAAALVLIAGAGVVGGLIGRQTAEPVAVQPTVVPGTKNTKATDPTTGTAITATVVPKAGWVTVHADVRNLPVGAKCQLRVVDKAGNFMIAGSWLVSEKTAKEGSVIDGGALIPIDQVKSIDVYTFEGQRMVSAPL